MAGIAEDREGAVSVGVCVLRSAKEGRGRYGEDHYVAEGLLLLDDN